MMMKKTTSALAVAALLGTGAASAATFQVDDATTFGISGDIEAVYNDVKTSTGASSDDITSGGGEIAITGEHAADNGITSFFRIGIDGFDVTNANDSTGVEQDSVAFFGARGDFGSVRFGSLSNAYEGIADITDIMFDRVVDGLGRGEQDQVVQYSSNNLNGLSFVVDAEIQSSDEQSGDQSSTSLSGRVNYDLGNATLMVGYDERGNVASAEERVGAGVAAPIAGFNIAAKYENVSDENNKEEFSVLGVTASRSFGDVTLFGVVTSLDYDAAPELGNSTQQTEDSFTQYGFGAYYSLTPTLTAHIETVAKDLKNDEDDGHTVGVTYKF